MNVRPIYSRRKEKTTIHTSIRKYMDTLRKISQTIDTHHPLRQLLISHSISLNNCLFCTNTSERHADNRFDFGNTAANVSAALQL